jgi:hypothetical protein
MSRLWRVLKNPDRLPSSASHQILLHQRHPHQFHVKKDQVPNLEMRDNFRFGLIPQPAHRWPALLAKNLIQQLLRTHQLVFENVLIHALSIQEKAPPCQIQSAQNPEIETAWILEL